MKTDQTSQRSETPITEKEGMFAHLVSNRLVPSPEVPSDTIAHMVDSCLTAVRFARQGFLDGVIELPSGVSHKGATSAQVHELIEAFELEDWLY